MAEEVSEPTIEELITRQADLARQIATRTIPEVEAAISLLNSETVMALKDGVAAIHARLGEGLAKQNLSNILQVLGQVPGNLQVALADLQRAVALSGETGAA